MREYKKPTIQVVNLKSAEDIAVSFKDIQGHLIEQYMMKGSKYAVTKYDLNQVSIPDASQDM